MSTKDVMNSGIAVSAKFRPKHINVGLFGVTFFDE